MASITKEIFAYNFTSKRNLLEIFDSYNNIFNNDRTNLKERNLVYSNSIKEYKYVLDIIEKKTLTVANSKDNGKLTCCFKCILYKLRDTDLPIILNLSTGKKQGIQINLKDTLVEQTHFIVFPEINLILSEYNHPGARVEKILSVLDYVLTLDYREMDISPLLRKDNYDRILNSKEIKNLVFKTGHLGLTTLSEKAQINIFDTLDGAFDELSNLQIEITISGLGKNNLKPKDKDTLLNNLCNLSKLLISKKQESKLSKQEVNKLHTSIRDENYNLIPIDLLEDKLVSQIDVVKLNERYKYIDSDDMFNKILQLYKDNIIQLDRHIPII